MELLKIWVFGLILTVVVAICIWREDEVNEVIKYILIPICIICGGGIAAGWCIGVLTRPLIDEGAGVSGVVVGIIAIILLWCLSYYVLLFNDKDILKKNEPIIYFIVFIISTIAWSNPIYDVEKNYEIITEKKIANEE